MASKRKACGVCTGEAARGRRNRHARAAASARRVDHGQHRDRSRRDRRAAVEQPVDHRAGQERARCVVDQHLAGASRRALQAPRQPIRCRVAPPMTRRPGTLQRRASLAITSAPARNRRPRSDRRSRCAQCIAPHGAAAACRASARTAWAERRRRAAPLPAATITAANGRRGVTGHGRAALAACRPPSNPLMRLPSFLGTLTAMTALPTPPALKPIDRPGHGSTRRSCSRR